MPEHVGDRALDLHVAKLLALADPTSPSKGDVGPLVLDAVGEPLRVELGGFGIHVVYHVADVRGAGDDVAPANGVALELNVLLHRSHQQEERRMHAQHLADCRAQLLHALVAVESEVRLVAAEDLPLLLQKVLDQLGSREDFQRRPGSRNGAVVHATEEAGDQKANDLFVGDGPTVRIGRVQHGLHEVFGGAVALFASQLQNWLDQLVQ
mmetsp:Transcript_144798/g.204882  ORF Transcript_144798/g.204882 Transcript_144798/m.204882 type:complete len:209 (+) Transcript_144798:158-784(+)